MKKIATHNSITGEAGRGILSWLVAPFSKCQSKTLAEQYEAGVRLFDIRIYDDDGIWRCGHGLWTARPTLRQVLNWFAIHSDALFTLTYEKGDTAANDHYLKASFPHTLTQFVQRGQLLYIAEKKPKWGIIHLYKEVPMRGEFVNLDGSTWHTYLPLPWLWKQIYHRHVEFSENYFKLVDFV